MTIEELIAARDAAVAHMWAVWESIGGKAADEAVRTMFAAPQLQSEFVTEGTHGLPRRQAEQIKAERRGAQARAQARLNAAYEKRDELRLNPAFVEVEKASSEANDAIQKFNWANRPKLTKEEEAARMAAEIGAFRWNGKDNDGDWNE